MAAPSGGGRRKESAKAIVADQISQSVQSTSNLLHLMLQSSPSHASPTNEASKKPSGKDFHNKEYRDGLGAVASSNFITGCTYGKRTAECASFEYCGPVAF
ncbi:uncharacterized protein LOC105165687 isoform X2 [Sesamum indicum]|uniref:Uncharacterized protein LOC105165687 isoform X2 n=1 Tax=Sesamum indicum TaxID=4182 RepID=A0A8M8UT02_SESIN|nr:uncharacterized protein LOC105165687 isoform X2 [Sesamum indicum]